MVLALSSTISWSKVDYYYGVSWCSSVPHEGFTGFQGTVNWSPIGSRVLERPVQALRVLFNGI